MKMETLRSLRIITRPNDHWISFDLKDGFYSLAIAPQDREAFTVNLDGQLLQLCALPMGWSLSPFVFQKFTEGFTDYLRDPEATSTAPSTPSSLGPKALKKWRRRRRVLTGARLLPFVDDFAMFCQGYDNTLKLLEDLGLQVHPSKGFPLPTQVGEHLGMVLDYELGEFRAPTVKLKGIASLAKSLLCKAAANKRWVSVKALASLARKAQFLHMAIPVARFFLRELHDVVASAKTWSGTIRLTCQLKRDLQWWTSVPSEHNGSPIWKPVENAYLHCDSSSFGWGAVLNDRVEARGFWTNPDLGEHITFKELKAVRCAIQSFLPELKGRRILLHEDIQSVIGVLTHLTSKSPVMMCELRKLFLLIDTYEIKIRTQYIRSAANIWADALSRTTDNSDWQLTPRMFRHLSELWGSHSIDRFASAQNKQLPRYNARWRDGQAEAVDCLHLPDADGRGEHNWCNPPWELLDDLAAKLRQSGAAATIIAPYWPKKAWYAHLADMSSEQIIMPPSHDLFSPQRQQGRGG